MSSMSPRVHPVHVLVCVATCACLAVLVGHGCDRYEVQQPVNNPPTSPSNPSPASDTTTVVESLTPMLSWEGGDDADQDAVLFDVVMGTELPLTALATTDENHLELDVTHRLPGDAVIFWQVVARDGRGASSASSTWAFRTAADANQAPTVIGSPVPAVGDTGVAIDVLLQWFGGEDPEGAPVNYIARIDTLADFSSPAVQSDSTLGDQRYRPAATLLAYTTYYWQVTAEDTVGARTRGDVWSFTTGAGPSAGNDPPNPVGAPIPADGTTGVSVTYHALRWAGGRDPDGDPVTFTVYLGTGGELVELGTTTEKRFDLPERLAFASVHGWRVDAEDDHGNVTPGPSWSFSTEVNDPPTPITDPSPADGAVDQPADVVIAWQGGLDPEDLELDYLLYLAESGQALELLTTTTRLFVPMETYGPLEHGKTYQWRVDARDSEGLVTSSDTWSFATVPNEAPTAPALPTPVDGQTGVSTGTTLTWAGAVDPEGDQLAFEVRLSTATPPTVIDTTGTRAYVPDGALEYVTTYYWQIVVWDEIGNTAAGPIWSFTTAASQAPSAPCAPITPEAGATGVGSSVGLSWSCGIDPEGDPVTFDVLMGTGLPLTTTIATGLQSRGHALTGLPAHTLYYWQVRATDGLTSPVGGPVWSFTTYNTAPGQPTDPTPADTAVDVDLDQDLAWAAVTDSDGDEVTYRVLIGEVSPPQTELGTTVAATIDAGTLDELTTYYWKVIAEDAFGGANPGPIWRFTTAELPNNAPNAATAPNPSDAATNVDLEVALTWIGSDPDGDDLTYDVHFGTTDPPPFLFTTINALYDPPGELAILTDFYWQIVSRDDGGLETAGPVWSFTTGIGPNLPPPAPGGPVPGDGAVDVDAAATLSWNASIDPDGDSVIYDVHVGVSNPPGFLLTTSATSYDPPGNLGYGTVHYWQIVARDGRGGEGAGPVWSFTTAAQPNNPPTAPAGPSPSNGAVGVAIESNLSWTASTDPDTDPVVYDVYLATSNPPTLVSSEQSAPSYNPPGVLDYDATYFWQVVAKDDQGGETTGPLWTFSTGTEPNSPPSAPNPLSPASGATGVSVSTTVTWQASTDPEGDDVVYEVYFGTTDPPPYVATQPGTTYDPPGDLDYVTLYYWRAKAVDDRGASTLGNQRQFTTESRPNTPPTAPNPLSPASGAVDQPLTTVIVWQKSTDGEGDPITYQVLFGTTDPPPVVATVTDTTYDPPGDLDYSTLYYWRARALDDHGGVTVGNQRQFTTIAEPNDPPSAPSTPSPADDATGVDTAATLGWAASTDPETDPVTYDVYLGTSSPPALVSSDQSATSYDPGGMANATEYFWKVVARDDHGNETASLEWSFTTAAAPNQPPTVPSTPDPVNGATGVDVAATLGWAASSDPDTDPVTYDVYFGTSSPPALVSSDQSATSYDPGGMTAATVHFWKVVAKDDQGGETAGAEWSFTTAP